MARKKIKRYKERLRNSRERAREHSKKFKSEVKKAISTALVAAFGFLMALTWRELLTEYLTTVTSISPIQGKLIETIIITLISVAGILIITKILSE